MKFRQTIILSLMAFGLTACEHNLYFVSRKTGDIAEGSITTVPMQNGGEMSIVLKNKNYTGHWVFMENGGGVAFTTATATSGTHTAYGSSSSFMSSAQGGGTILASASDGSRLRCRFDYNRWSKTGVGLCELSTGEKYDLQIN